MNIEELNLDKTTYVQLKRAGVSEAEELITRGKEIQLLAPRAYERAVKVYDAVKPQALSPRERAEQLHQQIIMSGTLAAHNLWDMCQKLKEMRDEKLYKELGYQTFEEYCEKEVGMSRSNVYNYISIAGKIKSENVQSIGHLGMTKLSLLAQLTESQQEEISEAVDLEEVSVRQLKEEIAKLKEESEGKIKALTEGLSKAQKRANDAAIHEHNAREAYERIEKANHDNYKKLKAEREKVRELEQENEELRSRPVDVAVVDNSDSERLLRETIKSLEAENIRQNEELDRRYLEDRRELERLKAAEVQAVRDEYEKKLDELKSQAVPAELDEVQKAEAEFQAYYRMAQVAVNALIDFVNFARIRTFTDKAGEMLVKSAGELEEV